MFPLAFCLNRDGGASLGIISMVRLGLKGHGNLTHAKPRTGDASFRIAGERPLRAGCLKGSGDLADVDHLTRTAPHSGDCVAALHCRPFGSRVSIIEADPPSKSVRAARP